MVRLDDPYLGCRNTSKKPRNRTNTNASFVLEKHLRGLIFVLKRLPDDARCVRHLLLRSGAWGKGRLWLHHSKIFETDKNRLLSLIAPTLRTLCLECAFSIVTLPFSFPALVDLTILSQPTFPTDADTAPRYPRLRRFYIGICPITDLTALLEVLPPSVKSLRISIAPFGGRWDPVLHLTSALKLDDSHPSSMTKFSPERILFQASPTCGSGTLDKLRCIAAASNDRFVLLKQRGHPLYCDSISKNASTGEN
jgi:hypothetical protein